MKNNTIRNVVATGIGAALFVVIGMINIPTPVPNTSIQLQYPLQALFSVIFGPIVGFLMGFFGLPAAESSVYWLASLENSSKWKKENLKSRILFALT